MYLWTVTKSQYFYCNVINELNYRTSCSLLATDVNVDHFSAVLTNGDHRKLIHKQVQILQSHNA